MPTTTEIAAATDQHRPLYIKRVPEATWIKIHENALRSRMRLQEYIVQLLEQTPLLPMPTTKPTVPPCLMTAVVETDRPKA